MAYTPKKPLAQRAYEGYCNYSNWKSMVSGADLPTWELVTTPIQEAWKDAADAVSLAVVESLFPEPEVATDGD
jgi:hypothetical protein